MRWNFEYGEARIQDFQVQSIRDLKTNQTQVQSIQLFGQEMQPTRRFWKSMFMRFGFSQSIFRYFDYGEVFERISEKSANDRVRYCVEQGPNGNTRLLSVSNPKRPMITHESARDLLESYGGSDIRYSEGVLTSTHRPRRGDCDFEIQGDRFKHRFVMETPIDGFSQPRIFLSFLRLLCSNGAIGYSRAFRSDVSLGKDIGHCISRALESYDNDEGYAGLRQRFSSSQTSWASLNECNQLYKLLFKLEKGRCLNEPKTLDDFHRMTGHLNHVYGLTNLDALSEKRLRVLPAKCRVYDLINFASEVATHHADERGSQTIQAHIGSLISDEYDMEGTANQASEFADFFVTSKN